jgi:hypothetical protein
MRPAELTSSARTFFGIAAALCPLFAACSPCLSAEPYPVASGPRDWSAQPAIVDLPAPSTIYALSDVHGGYDRLAALLTSAGITTSVPASPSSIEWAASDATLVVAGDLFDKGPQGLEVIDALMTLQTAASASGGRVVVTLGNHEAEFLADPTNCKADTTDGVDAELKTDEIDPMAIASGSDSRGAWLRNLPFGARIGRWFFAHAGNTKQRTIGDLEAALEADVTAHDYAGHEVIGDESLLESRDWFNEASAVADANTMLGVDHIVFGHSPHALGADGTIAVGNDGAVLRIDCGMSPGVDYSKGEVLRIRTESGASVADAISASGTARQLLP